MAENVRPNRFGTGVFAGTYPRGIASIQSINNAALWTFLRYAVFAVLLVRSIGDAILDRSLELGGSPIGFGAVINALVIAIAVLFVVQRPSTVPLAVFGIWSPFLLLSFAGIFHSPQFASAARLFLVTISYWALFVIPFFIFRSRADLPRFVLLVLASSIGPLLYAVVDIWHGMADLADFRLKSTFAHPNIFSFYLVLLLGLALYAKTSRAVQWPRGLGKLLSLYIPVLIFFLALTKTRSAWIAGGVMLLFFAVRFDRRFLLGFLFAPLLLIIDPSIGERLVDVTQGAEASNLKHLNDEVALNSFVWREVLWQSAIPMIAAKPFFGYGLESFRHLTPEFFSLAPPNGIDAHNFYVQVQFEMGLLGILALIWLLGSLAWRIANGLRYDRNGILVIFTILAAYLLESYSDNMIYYLSFNWYFWFTMGTICAWIEYERSTRLCRTRVAPHNGAF